MWLKKKGAIGMTITWIVGTIIVFFVLLLFLFAVQAIASQKKISSQDKWEIFPDPNEERQDYAEKKTYSGFILTPNLNINFGELKEKIGFVK